MWTALIAAALNAGVGIYNAAKSAKAYDRYIGQVSTDKSDAKAKAEYYSNVNPLETKQGSILATDARDSMRRVNEAAAGRGAVQGVGESGIEAAQAKGKTGQILANTYRSIISQNDAINNRRAMQYEGMVNAYNSRLGAATMNEANANADAASSALSGMGAALNMYAQGLGMGRKGDGNGTKASQSDVNGETKP